jgi:hypothetical protein
VAAGVAAAREVQHLDVRWLAPSELLDPELTGSPGAAFVGNSWCRSTKRPIGDLRHLVASSLVVIGIGVPVGEDDCFLGWAITVPRRNAIVACYVKHAFRASEFRVGSSLLSAMGIDFSRPVPCLTWSRDAEAVARKAGNPYRLIRADREGRR